MNPHYQFQMIPVIISKLDYLPKYLNSYMNNLDFFDKEIKMQCTVLSGMVKI